MHPLILQQLVTDRVNDMIATAADSRRAREARRTRRARTSGRRTQPGLPGTQPEFQPAASPTRATADDTGASWASRPPWARLAQPSLSSIRET